MDCQEQQNILVEEILTNKDMTSCLMIYNMLNSSIINSKEGLLSFINKVPCDAQNPGDTIQQQLQSNSGEPIGKHQPVDSEKDPSIKNRASFYQQEYQINKNERQMMSNQENELSNSEKETKNQIIDETSDQKLTPVEQFIKFEIGHQALHIDMSRIKTVKHDVDKNIIDMQKRLSQSQQIPELLQKQQNLQFLPKQFRRPRSDPSFKIVKEDTKNLLRNYGNAQNRFVLHSRFSENIINQQFQKNEEKIEKFKNWVSTLQMENFQQFQAVWQLMDSDSYEEFQILYRDLCFEFYEKHAIVYVFTSQMRTQDTRKTHIKYIGRFLEGIVDPKTFYYFKKSDIPNRINQI